MDAAIDLYHRVSEDYPFATIPSFPSFGRVAIMFSLLYDIQRRVLQQLILAFPIEVSRDLRILQLGQIYC